MARGRKKIEYIMYNRDTDLPVCIGTIEECAYVAGLTVSAFTTMISRKKDDYKWQLFDIDKLLEDYDENW
jgi:hypothetical protein